MLSRVSSQKVAQRIFERAAGFDWRRYTIFLAFVAIFVFFAITLSGSGFLSVNNLLNIVRQTAIIGVMAVAMTFVISAAEIDLSVGSVAGLASVVSAMTVSDYGIFASIVCGLLTGVVAGGINGLLVATIGIPSFLVTLAMLGIAQGSAMWATNAAPIPVVDQTFNNIFGSGQIGPVPVLFIWLAVILVAGHLVLRKAAYGRQVLATGGNEEAARFSGIKTRRIKFYVLLASGIVAALAGMLYAGYLQSGRYQYGQGDELSVIAAVILGGTSLFGGYGTVIGSVLGALLVGLINNGLTIMGLEYSQQQVIQGVIIILAVALARKGPKG
ncbi:ABC transporter permease [Rubrobacter calidifluminis]|uniref:ABC transporter permease n=1 Tax=Rubrobacter calidifluminis TaxID=1392640 RepID=UPI00235FC327|nr:ABC transporter permease [Rubrobacter calidifluminis]